MLGPVEVVGAGGRRVTIEGRRTRVVLAILLVWRNQTVSLDFLIDGLWPAGPPAHAKGTLHAYISKLRSVLGSTGPLPGIERITRRGAGYELLTLEGEVDADRFERALVLAEAAMREGRFEVASESLDQVLRLVRGPVLGECRDDPFAQAEVARLEAMHLRATEQRVDADLALGRHALLVGELEGLVAVHALHERFREQLMLALYRCGRQADALRVYQDAHRVLVEEVGLLPGPGLRTMEAAILGQDPALDLAQAPAHGAWTTARMPADRTAPKKEIEFVGRQRERAALDAAWWRAALGQRQFVVIEGESGMGKSRLASEFAFDAAEQGAVVLTGRAIGDALVPFYPFVEALKGYASRLTSEELERIAGPGAAYLAELLPGVEGLGPTRTGQRGAEASSHRYLMFEAVVALLGAVAAPTGAVLVLDDLHQADPSTLQLLETVSRHPRDARLLIIATFTTSDSDAGRPANANRLVSELVADGLATRLALDGLSLDEVGELLGAATGRSSGTPRSLARQICDLTTGIPLFVVELGKGLAELDNRQVEVLTGDLPISERIHATLEKRLNRVAPFVVRVLSTAAVIGATFDADVVAALCQQPASTLAGHLDAAMEAGLIHEDGRPGRYRFAHRLVQHALEQRVGTAARAALQGELANILIGPQAPSDTSPAEVAHHFERAARYHANQAVTYAIRAGDHAMAVLAFENAAALYRSACHTLRSFGDPDPALECQILVALGRAHHAAYQRSEAIATFREAAELAVALSDADALAAATWGLMITAEFSSADREAGRLLRQALAGCDEVDGPLRARLTAGLARVLPSGESEANRLVQDAIAMARRVGEPETLAWVLYAAVLVTWGPNNLAWRRATTDEVISLADGLGWVELAMEARNWRSAMQEEEGDFTASATELATLSSWATGSRRPFFDGLTAMRQAERALLEGRYTDAEEAGARMLGAGAESPDFVAGYGAQLLLLRRDQGRLAEIDGLVAQQVSSAPHVPAWRVAEVVVCGGLGREQQARRGLAALARGAVGELPRDWLWLLSVTLLADVCADLGARETAADLIESLSPFASLVAVLGHGIAAGGAVSGPLGRVEALDGRWSVAERHFRNGLALNEHIGARPALVRTQIGYADMLLQRGRPGDASRAVGLLETAGTTADRLGMAGVDHLLQRTSARHKKTARGS